MFYIILRSNLLGFPIKNGYTFISSNSNIQFNEFSASVRPSLDSILQLGTSLLPKIGPEPDFT